MDAFHPDLAPLRHVRAADLDAGTAQTPGMRRLAAIYVISGRPEFVFLDQRTGDEVGSAWVLTPGAQFAARSRSRSTPTSRSDSYDGLRQPATR